MTTENQNPTQGTESAQSSQEQTQSQATPFQELASKKGFKTPDDLAKSYTEAESSLGKHRTALNTAKAQIETQSGGNLTLDDNGNVIVKNQSFNVSGDTTGPTTSAPGSYTPPQQNYNQPQPVWDEHLQRYVTDPIEIQLSKYPLYQRQALITQAILEQNNKWNTAAYTTEQEILNTPEAKGFEQDIKNVMGKMPPQVRANKEAWKNAILQVKGARYDEDRRRWSEQGVNEFLDKSSTQSFQPAGQGSGDNVQLTPQQEESWRFWQTKSPGKFKSKAEFARFFKSDGGR